MSDCQFIKTDGTQCGMSCLKGEKYCFIHHPDYGEERKAAQKKGGINKGCFLGHEQELKIETPEDIKKVLAMTINELWTGLMPAREPGNSIGFLSSKWLEAYDKVNLSEEIKSLQKKIDALPETIKYGK